MKSADAWVVRDSPPEPGEAPGDIAVAQPVEQRPDAVVAVGHEPVPGDHRAHDRLAHDFALSLATLHHNDRFDGRGVSRSLSCRRLLPSPERSSARPARDVSILWTSSTRPSAPTAKLQTTAESDAFVEKPAFLDRETCSRAPDSPTQPQDVDLRLAGIGPLRVVRIRLLGSVGVADVGLDLLVVDLVVPAGFAWLRGRARRRACPVVTRRTAMDAVRAATAARARPVRASAELRVANRRGVADSCRFTWAAG
jgi:hypothetical protein